MSARKCLVTIELYVETKHESSFDTSFDINDLLEIYDIRTDLEGDSISYYNPERFYIRVNRFTTDLLPTEEESI